MIEYQRWVGEDDDGEDIYEPTYECETDAPLREWFDRANQPGLTLCGMLDLVYPPDRVRALFDISTRESPILAAIRRPEPSRDSLSCGAVSPLHTPLREQVQSVGGADQN